MPSLTRGNLKAAIDSVTGAKWRSLLTMLGIIIGIVSVVTIVSIGEGVKQQVANQSNTTHKDLITVRPGKLVNRDKHGKISSVNFLPGYAVTGSLNTDDVKAIQKTRNVQDAVPLSVVAGVPTVNNEPYPDVAVIGSTGNLPTVLGQHISYGDFFSSEDSNQNGAVIGMGVARSVFGEDVPLGESFELLGQTFVVRGVFDKFSSSPLSLETDFNNAIFIPYEVSKELTNNHAAIYEILAKSNGSEDPGATAERIRSTLAGTHGDQQDFTVLRAGETLNITSNILNLLTRLIGGIAAISLLVGGIGIMNVMLVSVTERMQEIGIRKAVGATSRQIMNQFMIEATVLSVIGGIIGVAVSLLINVILRVFTNLQPAISWQVMLLAVAVSVAVGIIFGTAPALKAARKDPIEALRNE
jgi:putative ABC transport system permease protein